MNTKQTSTVAGEKLSVLGSSTDSKSEHQKSARSAVVPHGRPPVCSLDGATFIDLELAHGQAKFGNLNDSARTERHTH